MIRSIRTIMIFNNDSIIIQPSPTYSPEINLVAPKDTGVLIFKFDFPKTLEVEALTFETWIINFIISSRIEVKEPQY